MGAAALERRSLIMKIDSTGSGRRLNRVGSILATAIVSLLLAALLSAEDESRGLTVIAVIGAEGAEEFAEKFQKSANFLKTASEKGEAEFHLIGMEFGKNDDAETLKKLITAETAETEGELWIILIGHGSFDGRTAKFNVRGPDFTDKELAEWLADFDRPLAVVNTASASAPFLKALSGPDRIVVTATKSAQEIFYTRFGEFFAEAIGGLEGADLDNDEQVSLLEAYLYSAEQVSLFYENEGRLATEHALIDDNGDQMGTRADWFEGVLATRMAKQDAEPDGERAHQRVLVPNETEARMPLDIRKKRDALELKVKVLVRKKRDMKEDAYYAELEKLLLEIAKIYEAVEGS